jgi:hypothetical protein
MLRRANSNQMYFVALASHLPAEANDVLSVSRA